jgi:mitogen-activated protein kinase 15
MLEATPPTRPLAIAELCTGAPTEAIDLITQCITFNPSRRPDAEQALRHPFLAEFHDPDDEPGYEGGPVVLDINDNTRLAPNEYREALYAEVMRRKAALRKSEVLKMKTPGSTILQEAEGDKLGS